MCIGIDIKKIEVEAQRAGMTRDVVKALISGYEEIASRCNNKYQSYYDYGDFGEPWRRFASKCKKRIKELSSYQIRKRG